MQISRLSFTILFFFFFLCGLSGKCMAEASEAKEIKILASFYPMYIIAKNVARDVPGVSVRNFTSPFVGCLHDYALTPDDLKKLVDAQVLVANGAGLEPFLERIAGQYPDLKIVQLSEGIDLIKVEGNGGVNPHVWVSVSNVIIQVKNLGVALEEFDSGHKELYAKNTADYSARLEALKNRMHTELAPYIGKGIITFHEAFPYFAREFGLNIVAVVEREPASQPSAKELADTIALVKKSANPVLFSEPQYPDTAARIIANETGAKVYLLDPAVTGPDDYDAYINIMENNLKVLKEAFRIKSNR